MVNEKNNSQPDEKKLLAQDANTIAKGNKNGETYLPDLIAKLTRYRKALKQEKHIRHRLQKENEYLKEQLKESQTKISSRESELMSYVQKNVRLNQQINIIMADAPPVGEKQTNQEQVDTLMQKKTK